MPDERTNSTITGWILQSGEIRKHNLKPLSTWYRLDNGMGSTTSTTREGLNTLARKFWKKELTGMMQVEQPDSKKMPLAHYRPTVKFRKINKDTLGN